MEAAPGQQQELAVRNQHLPGSVAPSWAGDSGQDGLGTVARMGWGQCPGWGTLTLGHAGARDWCWAMQYRDRTRDRA